MISYRGIYFSVIKFPSILFCILFVKSNKLENVLNALKTGKRWIFNFNYIEKYIFHSIGREESFKMVYFSSNSEYFEDFIENLIFHVNASNGIALQ